MLGSSTWEYMTVLSALAAFPGAVKVYKSLRLLRVYFLAAHTCNSGCHNFAVKVSLGHSKQAHNNMIYNK